MLHKSGDYSRAEQRHSVTLSRFRTSDVVSVVSKPGPIILPVMWRPPQHRDIVTLCPCHQGEGCSKHGRLKTEVWTNTTHNCLLRSVSVGNAGTDTREEFAKTALNLSIFFYFELRMPKVAAAFFVLCFEDQWLNSIPPGSKLANLHYLLLLSPLLLHLSDLWTQKMERHLWPQLSFGGVQSQE